MLIVHALLGVLFAQATPAPATAQAAPPPPATQIAAAVLAAPEERRAAATVLGYDASGALVRLREGSNDLVCLADDPKATGFSVACYHKDLEPFMARGRALSAQGVSGQARNDARWKEIEAGTLPMPREPRTLYVLSGKGYDAAKGEAIDSFLRWVIYVPFATAESTGLPTRPVENGPWLMNPGTAGAHIMITPARPAQKPSGGAAPPAAQIESSYRSEQNGWIFVHLEGPPAQIGYQHGYQLAPEIADLLRVTKPLLKETTKKDWAFYRDVAERILWPGIDEEYRAELDGIVAGLAAKGVAVDRWDIVALNSIEEIPGYYLPWLQKQQGQTPITHAPGNCSAFVATGDWTKDHRIVMGHNAWTNYITGERWNIVFDIKPARGHRIVMDGLPGIIASDDDFGINDAGIMITETTITQFEGFDPKGTPEFYRARKAMQYAESIDDFVRIMTDRNNGGYANDWLIGDNKTGEIARLELGLKNWTIERTKNGYYVGSNFPVGPKLIKEETTFNTKDRGSSPNARRTRWEQLMAQHKGRIDVELARQFEADPYDVIEKRNGPTERSLCGAVEDSPRGIPEWDWGPYFAGGTVQAKVVDAAMTSRLEIWAAMGRPCTTDFKAEPYLSKRPEYGWMRGLLRDMPTGEWTLFRAR